MSDEQVDLQAATVPEKLREAFDDGTPLALIAADVDRVQNYVFESAKLAEMRGASLILDLLNVKDSDDKNIWGDVEINEKQVTGIPQVLKDEFPLARLVYASGGGAMIVSELAQAEEIKERIEKLYAETTLTGAITVVYEHVRLADLENKPASTDWIKTKMEKASGEALRLLKDNSHTADKESDRGRFSELYASLGYQLRRAKQSKLTAPIFEVSSFTERCGYCHFRPAREIAPEVDERPICQVCIRKRQDKRQDDGDRAAQSFYLGKFRDYLEIQAKGELLLPYSLKWAGAQSPPDLEAIAEAAGGRANNFVGVIYADGNDMGAQLERLKSAAGLGSFADEVRTAMEQAVFSGLGTLLNGPCDGEREYRGRDGQKRKRKIKHHPFEIITIGGDDVYLIVPADVALEMAQHICQEFGKNQNRNLTLAAGVLITDVTTPIYFSRQIVKGLLKNAKKLSKAEPGKTIPAVDFQVITTDTAITEDISGFRKKAYRTSREEKDADGLTTRPLTLDQLKALIEVVRDLKNSSFPKSQLYALREAVVSGPRLRATNFYYYQQARSGDQYERLHKFLDSGRAVGEWPSAPFWKAKNEWLDTPTVTPIVDILEIYDFVREKKSGEGQEEKA